jgi:ABC-2 type transport system ATP-binding protein
MQNKLTHETVLSIQGLGKIIRGRHIVQNLSFEVRAGEIFGFLGPNGAGKTTTIRMLVGLVRPSEGSIHIAGHDLKKSFTKAISHVGCIVENPELYPSLTGYENLEFFARMAGLPKKRIDEVIEQACLSGRIHDPVKTYSLGMKQRLGIAQALLNRPKLLILDEPTNGLDPSGIHDLRSFIRRLAHEEGISVFLSSHILHEIQALCDRVAIIQNGQFIYTGPVHPPAGDLERVEWKVTPCDQGMHCLKQLPYVTNIEKKPGPRLSVEMPAGKISETNQYLLNHQIQVWEITPRKQTLEDLYMNLTKGDAP